MSGTSILGLDLANNTLRNLTCDPQGNLIINSSGGGGSGGDASASNQLIIIDNQTNGTQLTKVGNTVGDGSGTETFLKTATDGSVHVVVENSDNVLIKGVQDGTTTQKDAKTNSNGDLRSALIGNTDKDGTGTNYYVLVDSDGKLVTSGGGGGGGSTQYDMGDALGATPTGTVALGRDGSGNAQALQVSASGNQFVELADFQKGNTNMANSFCVNVASDQSRIEVDTVKDEVVISQVNQSVINPATFTSTKVDMRGYDKISFFGTSTNTTDMIYILQSADDSAYYTSGEYVTQDFTSGDFSYNATLGVRYLKLQQGSGDFGGNFTITCISSKK